MQGKTHDGFGTFVGLDGTSDTEGTNVKGNSVGKRVGVVGIIVGDLDLLGLNEGGFLIGVVVGITTGNSVGNMLGE